MSPSRIHCAEVRRERTVKHCSMASAAARSGRKPSEFGSAFVSAIGSRASFRACCATWRPGGPLRTLTAALRRPEPVSGDSPGSISAHPSSVMRSTEAWGPPTQNGPRPRPLGAVHEAAPSRYQARRTLRSAGATPVSGAAWWPPVCGAPSVAAPRLPPLPRRQPRCKRPGVQFRAERRGGAAKLAHLHFQGVGNAACRSVSTERASAPLRRLSGQGMLI